MIDASVRNEGVLRYKGLSNKHLRVVRKGLVTHLPSRPSILHGCDEHPAFCEHHHLQGLTLSDCVLDDSELAVDQQQDLRISLEDAADAKAAGADGVNKNELRTSAEKAVKNSHEKAPHHPAEVPMHARCPACESNGVWLLVQTTQSRVEVACALCTRLVATSNRQLRFVTPRIEQTDETIGQLFTVDVEAGRPIDVHKLVALVTSRDKAISEASIDAQHAINRDCDNFRELLVVHQRMWQNIWGRISIKVKLNPGLRGEKLFEASDELTPEKRVNLILRYHTFELHQVGTWHMLGRDASIPARGLSGEAYRGHIFWDEMFIAPFFSWRLPEVTHALVLYRYHRLDRARDHACELGHVGACFPWQSGSNGREETQRIHFNPLSGTWKPDNSYLQFHVNVSVFYNVWHYFQCTGDMFFMELVGAEMMLEIARFWSSLAIVGRRTGRYEILGVMGPDEFHEKYPDSDRGGINNNAYTNIMVAWLLRQTRFCLKHIISERRRKELVSSMDLTFEELARWKEMSKRMYVPISADGIIQQFDDWDRLKELDWDGYRGKYGADCIGRMDRILDAEGDSTNRYKVCKQADTCMIFYLLGSKGTIRMLRRLGIPFSGELINKNIKYYLQRTSHGSTLSKVVFSDILHEFDMKVFWLNCLW
eukprot:TRINITY_DN2286_c0_g1_i2.p1 TRINITY_DN2286_c0_g1~~TRINITY_DN2286_c0_g1_i2.p1  ORF type:complete len:652 (+),score=253.44 TRINITY_DN2286_c0_g1_i2:2035-3990(+)